MECIICFENIDNTNYKKFECCQQIVHISCLEKWITTNINIIKDISYCFYCKQKNDNIDYIINIINNPNNNNNNNNNEYNNII